MKKTILIASLSAILLSANISFAASFNCKKASTLVEKAICQDKSISKLDESMADNYQRMKKNLEKNGDDQGVADLVDSQKNWLSERNQCKTSKCVKKSYQKRMKDFEAYWQSLAG